jgi:hypothetical protein
MNSSEDVVLGWLGEQEEEEPIDLCEFSSKLGGQPVPYS